MWLFVVALALGAVAWNINAANAGDGGVAGGGSTGLTWFANSPAPDPLNPVFDATNPSGTPIRKFIDKLPGLGPANANLLGQYIPIAAANTRTFPGNDYYRIGEVEYTEQLHRDLPKATRLRGYLDMSSTTNKPHYLGPLILAKKNRAVRLLVTNSLPIGTAGQLFIPTDGLLMGAGMGPLGTTGGNYTQNRASVHLHGGFTPWSSDGTPHQYFTPAGDPTPYKKDASFRNVSDMVGVGKVIPNPTPGDGLGTYYYTNAQSGRLMFYHEHAVGITRLGVYVGLAAPYLLTDPTEDDLIDNQKVIPGTGAGVYKYGIPLVIQDRTFVPNNIDAQDSAWNPWRTAYSIAGGVYGDLWFPHKYEPNQDPRDNSGASQFGRWDYGPWFWPPQAIANPINDITQSPGAAHQMPGMTKLDPNNSSTADPWSYNTSAVPEAFMDTMMVNGHPYPYLDVQPQAYRFRVLNACNDRNINLSLFVADNGGGGSGAVATATIDIPSQTVTGFTGFSGGANYTSAPNVYIYGGGGTGAAAVATMTAQPVATLTLLNGGSGYSNPKVSIKGGGGIGATATAIVSGGVITSITLGNHGSGYTTAPLVSITGGQASGQRPWQPLSPPKPFQRHHPDQPWHRLYRAPPTIQIGGPSEVKMVNAVGGDPGLPGRLADGWPGGRRAGLAGGGSQDDPDRLRRRPPAAAGGDPQRAGGL